MNTIIYNLIKNFLSVIVICLTSITSFNLNQENIQIYNQDNIKSTNISNKNIGSSALAILCVLLLLAIFFKIGVAPIIPTIITTK